MPAVLRKKRRPRKNRVERRTFTVILEPAEEGGFHAFCPSLPGCHSEGDAVEETLRNIEKAVGLYLDSLRAHGEAIPREDILIKPLEVSG